MKKTKSRASGSQRHYTLERVIHITANYMVWRPKARTKHGSLLAYCKNSMHCIVYWMMESFNDWVAI